jgi:hypothetical protein
VSDKAKLSKVSTKLNYLESQPNHRVGQGQTLEGGLTGGMGSAIFCVFAGGEATVVA